MIENTRPNQSCLEYINREYSIREYSIREYTIREYTIRKDGSLESEILVLEGDVDDILVEELLAGVQWQLKPVEASVALRVRRLLLEPHLLYFKRLVLPAVAF